MITCKTYRLIILAFSLIILFNPYSSIAFDTPIANNGKKWRIGYYEGGPYSEYRDTMRTLIDGLIEKGWITDKAPPAVNDEPPTPYWNYLTHCNSPYLSFSKDDAYSASWEDSIRAEVRKKVMSKLISGKLDLIIAMGTWAGQDIANDDHKVPTMVLSTSDPISAGIIKSAENSGRDHVTARVDPSRYLRQLRMFHRITGFKTIGIAYENTPDGKIYAAFNEVKQVAKERNFDVVAIEVIDSTADLEKADASCLNAFHDLSQTTDAIYVTALTCVDRKADELADIFKKAKIPSFSMVGSKFVQRGMMLSISSDSGYKELGRYNAMKLGEILNGAKPSSLPQVFEDPLNVAINMKTVKEIGFNMPDGILRIATEIYYE